ncbi:FliM/FliN family flagellar motor switch protein [Tropicibacter naphthalenivorans]|uniref:Flagellar motor switch protein FliN n=1 Tax=Tropicibacter naphthalenivorans TaxID=441103 RepID=A0A0P1GCP3_9RHOB|nr:FliM/FliN family flagellar motor C-terminal domain-containing protein [Tropicibacter naphthalenivorans]CUH79122.1 Flagellar motor switch protein FliN [Tropicibacter naphthalenivorans]SMD03397.1 flagellar motor switch protein FliN/FliY [Tropicibacter naphthalenivorans]
MDSTQTAMRSESGTPFTSVPIEITVSVGRARPLVRELLQLAEGSVLSLDKQLDDPVELYVGEKLIGIGVLEVVEGDGQGQLAVRLTEVVDLQSPS